jgi:DNA polymerase-3 subunit epsilon
MTGSLRQAWQGLASALGIQDSPELEHRWVVVDVETTGLDSARDALLSVGAVALRPDGIDLSDSFEAAVRPPQPSGRDNILIHRIGAQAQAAGDPPEQVCRRFLEFTGASPLVGFHVAFDQQFLSRAMRHAGLTPPANWLDVAELARAVRPEAQARALDEWLEISQLRAMTRHSAASDALATAMLFQWVLARVGATDRNFRRLRKMAQGARWLGAAR